MVRRDRRLLFALLLSVSATPFAYADPATDVIKPDTERLEPGIYPAAPGMDEYYGSPEPAHPPFKFDWSVGLKGTYTSSSTKGGSFSNSLTPNFSAAHEGVRTDFTISGNAEIVKAWNGSSEVELPALRLGIDSSTRLANEFVLHAGGDLNVSRELMSAPGLAPEILSTPTSVTGAARIGLERAVGRFNIRLDGDIARTLYGDTHRSDTGITSNSNNNMWEAGAKLRVGYVVSPVYEVFGEAGVSRDIFDAVSPSLGVKTDATARTLRVGVAGKFDERLTATASIGVGQHDFDDGALTDITTQLYDAGIVYRPNSTIALSGNLATTITPSGADSAGTAKVEHSANLGLAYTVNSWLRLRASADWGQSRLEGTSETEQRHGFGTGADYVLGAKTALSADYSFEHRDNNVSGEVDTHKVSVGITLRR